MGDFREQLLKAGLVSAEQVREAEAREAPKPPPRPGGRGAGDRRGGGERAGGGATRPPSGPGSSGPTGAGAEAIDPHKVAKAGRLEGRFRGGRRWYYVSRRGTVPFMEVNDDAVGRLEAGQAGLVESPTGDVWLVDGDCARALASDERGGGRDWVRAWAPR